eukprot:9322819-Pyramimonas_sp.AAC.1
MEKHRSLTGTGFAPSGIQTRTKTPPNCSNRAREAPTTVQEGPKATQETPKAAKRSSKTVAERPQGLPQGPPTGSSPP